MWIALLTVLLDQGSKILAEAYLQVGGSVAVAPGFLYLTLARNSGAAFGIFRNQVNIFVFLAVAVIAVALVLLPRLPSNRRALRWGLALLLGGALGNLIDRLRWGYVIDFIDLRIWPVFNVADMAIVAGALLLCWEILRQAPEGGRHSEPTRGGNADRS